MIKKNVCHESLIAQQFFGSQVKLIKKIKECRICGGEDGELAVTVQSLENSRISGLDATQTRQVLDEVVEFAELGEYFDLPIRTYSSGMRARLSFGLSMAFEFNVYLIDELTAVGDAIFREKAAKAFAAIREERGRLYSRLAGLPGVLAFPSRANFVLFRVGQADAVFAALKARGVLVKILNGSHAMLAGCLRVTVGTAQENERFLEALQASLAVAA